MELFKQIVDVLWTNAVSITVAHYWWRNVRFKVGTPSASHNSVRNAICPHWKVYNEGCSGKFGRCDCNGKPHP